MAFGSRGPTWKGENKLELEMLGPSPKWSRILEATCDDSLFSPEKNLLWTRFINVFIHIKLYYYIT